MACQLDILLDQFGDPFIAINMTACVYSGTGPIYQLPIIVQNAVVGYAHIELDGYALFIKYLLEYIPHYFYTQDPFVFSHAILPFFFYILTHNFALSLIGHIIFEFIELHYQQFAQVIIFDEIGGGGIISDMVTGLIGTCLANRIVVYNQIPAIVSGPGGKWRNFWRGFFAFCTIWLVSYGCRLTEMVFDNKIYTVLVAAATGLATIMMLTTHLWLFGTETIVNELWYGNRDRFIRNWSAVMGAVTWVSLFLVISAVATTTGYVFVFINSANIFLILILHLLILDMTK